MPKLILPPDLVGETEKPDPTTKEGYDQMIEDVASTLPEKYAKQLRKDGKKASKKVFGDD